MIFTVSSGGREEVRRREVAEARCKGGGARVSWRIVISPKKLLAMFDSHLESPGAAAEVLNVVAARKLVAAPTNHLVVSVVSVDGNQPHDRHR